ncbi:MAG TPA: 5'-nucleotidase, lipoprotein e(P4) family [Bacteroidales bacterium]|nr:5'-nucleotidase, lipoprotein e(P4) family [Bacteroidales bacterium]
MKKINNMKSVLSVMAVTVFLFSCTTLQDKKAKDPVMSIAQIDDFQVLATLYNYFAAEYKALAFQAYNTATMQIDEYHRQMPDAENLAVVVDIDETLLDNSPYQAKMIQLDASYDSCWNTWCNLSAARPVPGSVECLNHADSLGFNIFYVSNRKDQYVREGTIKNLKALGFPQVTPQHLYLREKTSDKEARRKTISGNYNIVLLIGDNIGDFYEDTSLFSKRDSTVLANKYEFGHKFIVLPNAMYGNWPASLGIRPGNFPLDSLLNIMTTSFGHTCSSE